MDKSISCGTRLEVLEKLRRSYQSARSEHRKKLIDQAVELLGYHRKSAIRALNSVEMERGRRTNTGRPVQYDAQTLTPWLKQIWQANDYVCSRQLAVMLPAWIPAFEAHEQSMPREVRERLLRASARKLDRLLEPLRGQT